VGAKMVQIVRKFNVFLWVVFGGLSAVVPEVVKVRKPPPARGVQPGVLVTNGVVIFFLP